MWIRITGAQEARWVVFSLNINKKCVGLSHFIGGWNYDTSYRFQITHLPDEGIIRLKLYEGATLLHDTGDIIDNGEEALRGGRMGVFCYSQQDITWSALSYRCELILFCLLFTETF